MLSMPLLLRMAVARMPVARMDAARTAAARMLALGVFMPCALAMVAGAHADTVLPERSQIAFSMQQMGVRFDGRFRRWKADIVFRPQALAQSHAIVDVDLASIDLASDDSERESSSAQWFDTARFPVAHFASTAIRGLGGNRYEVVGKLSLKGIVRDYVVPIAVTTDATGNRVADGVMSVRRLDHKVGEGEWADTGTVADEVAVRIRMVLAPGG